METKNPDGGAIVVIGFAESLAAPEVAWSLAGQGWKVIAFTRKGDSPALRSSRHVSLFEITPPESSSVQALADLTQYVNLLKQDNPKTPIALMPMDDAAVWLLPRAQASSGVRLAGPMGGAAALALNKAAQIELAQKAGFSVPRTRQVDTPEDISRQPIDFPIVFKPVMAEAERDGKLGRGKAWTCANPGELTAAVGRWRGREPMLLQQYVAGVGEGLFGLATDEGVIGWSAHRRLRMMNPQGSGSSACESRKVEEGLRAACERFISFSGWRGLFMIELLREETGKVWFMELNGRAWGSMALARRLGLEYPAWAVRKALQPEAKIVIPPPNSQPLVCRNLGRELLHLLFVMRGPKSKALTRWPSRWGALRQVLSFHRHDRWYNWQTDDRMVFFSDAIGTVKHQLCKTKGAA